MASRKEEEYHTSKVKHQLYKYVNNNMYDQTEVEFLVNLIISTQKSEKSFSPYEYDYHSLNTTSQFPTASTALSSPVSSLKSFSSKLLVLFYYYNVLYCCKIWSFDPR